MEIKSKLNKSAALLAVLGSVGYLLRVINHFTYYVIKIKYGDALLYGLLPCLLIGFYAVSLFLKKKPFSLPGFSACAVTLYSLIVALTTEISDGADVISIVVIALGFVFAIIYLLTFSAVIKTKTPACVLSVINAVMYTFLFPVSIYVCITSKDSFASYFGELGSVSGLMLFYISVALSCFSLKINKKDEKTDENDKNDSLISVK